MKKTLQDSAIATMNRQAVQIENLQKMLEESRVHGQRLSISNERLASALLAFAIERGEEWSDSFYMKGGRK